MRQISLTTLTLCALLASSSALAGERPLVAVLDFDVKDGGLNRAEEIAVTEDARKVALEVLGDRYDIITRENLVDLLKSHGKTLEKCQGECETETGRLIGAELVVTGRVARVFGKYKLTLKVHQTDPPKLLGMEDTTTDQLVNLPKLVKKLSRQLYESAVPGRDDGASVKRRSGGSDGDWDPGSGKATYVTFESEPPGAEVWVNGKSFGKPRAGKRSFTRKLPQGRYTVEMTLDLYKAKSKKVWSEFVRKTPGGKRLLGLAKTAAR